MSNFDGQQEQFRLQPRRRGHCRSPSNGPLGIDATNRLPVCRARFWKNAGAGSNRTFGTEPGPCRECVPRLPLSQSGGRMKPTILFDEVDTVFGPKAKDNEEIRGLLNAGHRRGAVAGRCVAHGKVILTEEIPAYCAVAMAELNDLPDTICRGQFQSECDVSQRRFSCHQRQSGQSPAFW